MKNAWLTLIIGAFSLSILIASMALAQQCSELKGQWPDKKTGRCVTCPKGQWFHPDARRCVVIGEDPTGEVDKNLCRQMVEEGQGYMLDGLCCPSRTVYQKCLRSGHKFGQGACKSCCECE